MDWWQAGLCGAAGALLVEVADLLAVLEKNKALPWNVERGPSRGIYWLAAAIRTALGIGVAVLLGAAGQVSGIFGAALAGIAAPKIMERLKSQASLPEQRPAAVPSRGSSHLLGREAANTSRETPEETFNAN